MKKELAPAWARLRAALYNPSPMRRPGKCLVNQADLEFLLAEVEALSNVQMARYLSKIVLEELRNGDQAAEGTTNRKMERRGRRHPAVRHIDRPATAGRVAEVAGPFTFGDEEPLREF